MASFHRTYLVFVSLTTDKPSHVVMGDEVVELPLSQAGADSLRDLDAGLDLIRTKTGRRIVSVFLWQHDERSGDRFFAAVTSPTL